ncbi:MAG: LuxR C-terminal-related transcriptional regulator [bacterium]
MDAFESLSRADRLDPLGVADLELLATSAYMVGRDGEFVAVLERAHEAHLGMGKTLGAVRCAFWIGINLATRGEMAGAGGWFGRGRRLVERAGNDCVESGYLLIPKLLEHEGEGEWETAAEIAADAAEIADRFGDRDLLALALHEQGFAITKQDRVREGLALIDEAMVAVTTGELSPIVTGLVYCNVIAYCQELYEFGRAQLWTTALTGWCDDQPQMVAYSGQCLVHRAEVLQRRGAWSDALEQARLAGRRFAEETDRPVIASRQGAVLYRQGEVHRLKGEYERAQEFFRAASRCGWEPQPGLALLRLGQRDPHAASAAIRRAVDETTDPFHRAGLLPAFVEVMLDAGDPDAATDARRELERLAEAHGNVFLSATATHARGATDLAAGDARSALRSLRRSSALWQELEAPYELGRGRELAGLACRALGDEETAELELGAAAEIFERLGATPDLLRVDALRRPATTGTVHGLTPRESEVLRLVCSGKTNKEVAAELVLSERTVERHVSNIFVKLGVSSRSAATAFAYEHACSERTRVPRLHLGRIRSM